MNDEFPKRLRKLREEKRPLRSMAVTSELIGLPPGMIRKYERGERKPKADKLAAIADYFGVSMDYLWGRTDEKITIPKGTATCKIYATLRE